MLTRRQLLLSTTAATFAADKNAVARPNVLLILADDLASWMLGCYGNQEIRTPNIDRLARTGVRFINSFVCTPICSASRATLLTGRTPSQHGIVDFLTDQPIDHPPQGQRSAPASFAREMLLSDVLAAQGYNCGYVGKWHMGGDTHPGHGLSFTHTIDGGSGPYNDAIMYHNGQRVQEKGYVTEVMTQRACEFLDQQQSARPFFLTVAYQNPHTPYEGHPQKYYDLYRDTKFETTGWQPPASNALREKEMLNDIVGNLRRCAAVTTALDDQIPLLLRRLLDRKLLDNTLVIFTSDNGFLLGRHGLWSKGLASDPINMYEEVMAVPMLWSWPGKIPAEAAQPELISFYDFVPSICDVTRAAAPNRNLCGRSYAPIALRRSLPKRQPWRNLVFGSFRNTEMARDSRFKFVQRNGGDGPNELYDLSKDPGERVNLAADAEYITVRQALAKELAAWRQKTAS